MPGTTAMDRFQIYEAVCVMTPPQFQSVLVYLNLPQGQLLPNTVSIGERAAEILARLEQPGAGGLKKLEDALRRVAPHLLA